MVAKILLRLFILLLVGLVSYHSFSDEISLFSWHPTLMVIGYTLLMSEGILAFTSFSLGNGWKHSSRLTLHWSLQLTAIAFIATAFLSIYNTKQNYKKEHFESAHASLGLTTCLCTGGVVLGGIASRFGYLFKSVIHPVLLKSIHGIFGIITYLLAITTICYGLQTEWFRGRSHKNTISSAVTLTAVIGLVVVAKPLWTILSRLGSLTKNTEVKKN